MKTSSLLLAALLTSRAAFGAIDFFALPDKIVVPKSVLATPAPTTPPPVAATPKPAEPPRENAPDGEPSLIADGMYLKTPAVGGQNNLGGRFYDIGPDKGVLIGFQYTTGQNERGGSIIESLTPLFVRHQGKVTGITRGTRPSDRASTMLEARPGYAVGSVTVRAVANVEYLRVTFMRYDNGVLDPTDSYRSNAIGGRGAHDADTSVELRTDNRPFIGIYGKAGAAIHELGLLVRREATAPPPPPDFSTPRPRPDEWATHTPPPRTATPAPTTPSGSPPASGSVQVFACGSDKYTLFLNGREILAGSDSSNVESGSFAVVKGDVLAAVARDTGSGDLWFSLRVVRDGTTVLDAGDMLYQTTEPPTWKTSRLMSGFSPPKISTHRYKSMGSDTRPRLVRPGPKDSTASAIFLKGVVP
ncbi:MAG: hypothetical protein K8R23_16650 [Chthoniobacter sp.]|nr:hypothetical protein [Chthoniobacter sp.]